MKTVGIIGGVGPESTIEYYRFLIEAYRERSADGSYPPIIINSVNLQKFVDLITANKIEQFAEELVPEVEKLARAGSDFAVFASNTPHIVFDEVQRQSRIPLVSIVEATVERVKKLGFHKVGLIGTRFTMQGQFYPDVFSREGVGLVTPDETDREYIHTKYMNELLNNMFLPETRDCMVGIANSLRDDHGIEGLILGGTELPLLLRDAHGAQVPFLDTTRIHVDRIVDEMFS